MQMSRSLHRQSGGRNTKQQRGDTGIWWRNSVSYRYVLYLFNVLFCIKKDEVWPALIPLNNKNCPSPHVWHWEYFGHWQKFPPRYAVWEHNSAKAQYCLWSRQIYNKIRRLNSTVKTANPIIWLWYNYYLSNLWYILYDIAIWYHILCISWYIKQKTYFSSTSSCSASQSSSEASSYSSSSST